jgi:hypothetical protein
LRPFGPYQVSNFSTWSWSPVVCVEVSNWSNMSQSQICVELIEMVQYVLYSSFGKTFQTPTPWHTSTGQGFSLNLIT